MGAEAQAVSALNNPYFAEAFGIAAVPARLALERGRWAEASKLDLHPGSLREADWKPVSHRPRPSTPSRVRSARRAAATRPGARREIERLNKLQQVLTERKLAYWAEQVEPPGAGRQRLGIVR